MTLTRLLLTLAVTLAAVQNAAAGSKSKSTKSTNTQAFEITDYGFGVSMPATSSRSGITSSSKLLSPNVLSPNVGRSSGKH